MDSTDAPTPLTDEELLELAIELDEVRAEARALKRREDEIKEALTTRLAPADPRIHVTEDTAAKTVHAIIVRGFNVMNKTRSTRSTVNRKKLEAMHPEVFADVKETGATHKIEVNQRAAQDALELLIQDYTGAPQPGGGE
jgi:hypothetical protein